MAGGRKGIDVIGLQDRTRIYQHGNVAAMFNAMQKINAACLEADEILANCGVEGFSSLGYPDIKSKIDKLEEDLEILESVPGLIINEFVDCADSDFEAGVSADALGSISELHIDNISLNRYSVNEMTSLEKLVCDGDIQLSDRMKCFRIEYLFVNRGSLTEAEEKEYELLAKELAVRSNMQQPYSCEELTDVFGRCDTAKDIRLEIELIQKNYQAILEIRPKDLSLCTKENMVEYLRRLLPQKMTDVKGINTRQLVEFNNAIFQYSKENSYEYLEMLEESCRNRKETSDYNAKVNYQLADYDKYNEDYYAYTQLERLWGCESRDLIQQSYPNSTFVISKISVDLGKEFVIEGKRTYVAPVSENMRRVTGYETRTIDYLAKERQLTYTEEEFEKYLKDRGYTWEEYVCAVLDQFAYIDMFDNAYKGRTKELAYNAEGNNSTFQKKIRRIGHVTISEYMSICANNKEENGRFLDKDWPSNWSPRKREFDIVFDAIRMNPKIGELQIAYASRMVSADANAKGGVDWENPRYNVGTNAFAIKDLSEGDSRWYFTCRGTSDVEWIDDGLRACVKSSKREDLTLQMQQMLDFFEYVGDKEWNDSTIWGSIQLTVTGHSQGGNDAQMLTLLSDKYRDLITVCYSFDGEGHSPEMLEDLKNKIGQEEYDKLVSKIYGICGQEDFVNPLAECIIRDENMKYVELERGPIDVKKFHDEVSMFAQKNSITGEYDYTGLLNTSLDENGEKFERKLAPLVTELLWDTVKDLPPEQREGCATVLLANFQNIAFGKSVGIEGRKIENTDLLFFKLYLDEMKAKIDTNKGSISGIQFVAEACEKDYLNTIEKRDKLVYICENYENVDYNWLTGKIEALDSEGNKKTFDLNKDDVIPNEVAKGGGYER